MVYSEVVSNYKYRPAEDFYENNKETTETEFLSHSKQDYIQVQKKTHRKLEKS
jgi:hypothetical protein